MVRFVLLSILLMPLGATAQMPPVQQRPPGDPGMGGPMSGGQMPDPRQISGVPLPVSDVASGTVTVRVIRGQFSNPIAQQDVELTVSGAVQTAKTDEAGRAQFSRLPVGARVKASTTVAGERIDSQEFEVPARGGVRLMLVATDAATELKAKEDRRLAQTPAQPGVVVLGDQSRFVIEMGDDGLSVFNILQVANTARTPVQTSAPLVFDLPKAATGTTILEGSFPGATAAPTRVTVSGPFPPGNTIVQFAYLLPLGAPSLTIEQRLPAAMLEFTVLVQKIGAMQVASAQMTEHRDVTADGQSYVLGRGPALKAGDAITLTLSGLPHQPVWPRNLALTVAVVILAGGGWMALGGRGGSGDARSRRQQLQMQRERLFAELTLLEESRATGSIDAAAYAARRRALIETLEGVYAGMHEAA